jgi:phosphoribosylaminoimidazole-succinocarboxamide synthase
LSDLSSSLKLFRKGKIRDVYDMAEQLLIVASDRVSAYDVVLPDVVPGKGESLTVLSEFWFTKTKHIIPNHFLQRVDSRSMRVAKAERVDIEWVVRSHIYGSMWRAYNKGVRGFGGVTLPNGLRMAEELPQIILTPTTKSEIGHDLDITRNDAVDQGLVTDDEWRFLEERSFKLYEFYRDEARKRGIIVPDFKVEYGRHRGTLIQIDEPPTHDSARFWSDKSFKVGEEQEAHALDKEFLRAFLREYCGFTGEGTPPRLPRLVIEEISKRCVGAYEVLNGNKQIDDLHLKSLGQVLIELAGEARCQKM